ncbi:MAG: MFS transporter [Chloroflexi bacterium]|nr:MFS transporter [Chloroflexota bacterium]
MMPSRQPLFYGWIVVAALCLVLFITAGIRYAFGPFFKPMLHDLQLDRAALGLAFALNMLVYGVMQPPLGKFVDERGPRLVLLVSIVALAVGLAGLSLATSAWQLYLFYGVFAAIGMGGCGTVTAHAVTARWFVRRRGTALSLVSFGSMGGQFILIPLAGYMLLFFDWQTSYLILGAAAVLLVVPLALWVIKDRPELIGLAPDGDPTAASDGKLATSNRTADSDNRFSVTEAMRTWQFWLLSAGYSACGFSISLYSAHFVAMATDHGVDALVAATAMGILGGSSMVGVAVVGPLSDRFGRKNLLAAMYATRGFGLIAMFFVTDPMPLYLLSIALGFGWAGTSGLTSALTGDFYGRFSVGSIFGWIVLAHQIFAAAAAYVGGLVFDRTGSYFPVFGVSAALLLLGAALVLTIREAGPITPRRPANTPEPTIAPTT